jgi:hypothetical protein
MEKREWKELRWRRRVETARKSCADKRKSSQAGDHGLLCSEDEEPQTTVSLVCISKMMG